MEICFARKRDVDQKQERKKLSRVDNSQLDVLTFFFLKRM